MVDGFEMSRDARDRLRWCAALEYAECGESTGSNGMIGSNLPVFVPFDGWKLKVHISDLMHKSSKVTAESCDMKSKALPHLAYRPDKILKLLPLDKVKVSLKNNESHISRI